MSDASIDVPATAGAVLIGTLLSVYLTATTNGQAIGHLRRGADHWGWQVWLVSVMLASTAQTGVQCYALHSYLIDGFGNAGVLETVSWPLNANQALHTFLAFTTLLYFAAKLSTLSSGLPRTLLLAAIISLTLLQTVTGALAAYSWSSLSPAADIYDVSLSDTLRWEQLVQVVAQLGAAGLVAGALLVEARRPRWTVKSEGVGEEVVRLGCETGLGMAVVLACDLGVRLAFAQSGAGVAFSFVVPKVMLGCMLASIARQDVTLSGIANRSSSLTDFMKSTPTSSTGGLFGRSRKPRGSNEVAGITLSAIGTPIPLGAAEIAEDPSSGWLRRTLPSEKGLTDVGPDQAELEAEAKDTFDAAFDVSHARHSSHVLNPFAPSHPALPSTDFPQSVSHGTHASQSSVNPWATPGPTADPFAAPPTTRLGVPATRQLAGGPGFPNPAGLAPGLTLGLGVPASRHHPTPTATSASQYSHATGPSLAGQTVFRGDTGADAPVDDSASDMYHTMSYYGLGSAALDQGASTAIQVGTPKSGAAGGVFARQQQAREGQGEAY